MDARTTTPMRLLAAIVLTLGAWFVAPAVRAEARPAQVVVEYGTTLEAGAKAADQGKAAGSGAKSAGDKIGDLVDDAKANTPLFVVGIGAVMVTGLWKVVSR
jgi:hypothetical protein